MATVVEEILSWMNSNSYGIEGRDGNWGRVVHHPNIESMANKWLEMEKQQNTSVQKEERLLNKIDEWHNNPNLDILLSEHLGMSAEEFADYVKNTVKVGSKLKIVSNESWHDFAIGEIVVVNSIDYTGINFCCDGNNEKNRWLGITEAKLVTQ